MTLTRRDLLRTGATSAAGLIVAFHVPRVVRWHGVLVVTAWAVPGLGFVFTNWTGSLTTNKAVLTFFMQSNLVLVANFIDVARPTVSITSPPAFARLNSRDHGPTVAG